MTLSYLPNFRKGRSRVVSGIFRAFTLSLLIAAFGFTSLHAQVLAYVANLGGNTVSVIDTSSNTIIATIPVGSVPRGVAVSPDGTTAYVTNFRGTSLSVISTATNTVTGTISLPVGVLPTTVTVTPDGTSLYVGTENGEVLVVSTATQNITATIPAVDSEAAALTPNGAGAYGWGFFAVEAINVATNTVVSSISVQTGDFPVPDPLGTSGASSASTPGGDAVYVAGGVFNNVSVISTATNTVTAVITMPAGGQQYPGLAVSPDGSKVYVCGTNGAIFIIDTATNTLEASSIPVAGDPQGIAFTPDGAFVYVTSFVGNVVSVIDTSTNTVVATLTAGSLPFGIAVADENAPFTAFTIDNLNISPQGFHEQGDFTLGANSQGIDLAHQPVTLTIGSFSFTIPPGSFREVGGNLHFMLNATINGLQVNFNLKANGKSSTDFSYVVNINGVNLTGQPDPATVGLEIGANTGTTTVQF